MFLGSIPGQVGQKVKRLWVKGQKEYYLKGNTNSINLNSKILVWGFKGWILSFVNCGLKDNVSSE